MADGYALRFNSPLDSNGAVIPASAVTYNAEQERRLEGVGWLANADGTPRTGKRPGPGFDTTIATGPDRVTLAPGGGVISHSAGGGYPFWIPAAVTRNFAARPATGTSRIDLLIARIYDADVTGTTTKREVAVELIAGDAAATPAAPTGKVPDGAYVIRPFTVPATGDIAPGTIGARTVAVGGILPVASQDEQDALQTYVGLHIYREDLDAQVTYKVGGWTGPGIANVTTSSGADVTGVKVVRRGSTGLVNVNCPVKLAQPSTAVILTLPTGYRPPAAVSPWFATLRGAVAGALPFRLNANGDLVTDNALAANEILRGSFDFPL